MSNQLKGKDIHNLDEEKEKSKKELLHMFPKMSESAVGKHLNFAELLEEYDNGTIHGIEDFLDNKNYEQKGIKYLNGESVGIEKDTINKIEQGIYLVGIKKFHEKKSGETQVYSYMIIAKKKNNPMFDKLKDSISSFVNKTVGSNV